MARKGRNALPGFAVSGGAALALALTVVTRSTPAYDQRLELVSGLLRQCATYYAPPIVLLLGP